LGSRYSGRGSFFRAIRRNTSHREHLHPAGSGTLQNAGNFIQCGTRGKHIVNHNYRAAYPTSHFKSAREIPLSLVPGEAGLARCILLPAQQPRRHWKAEPRRNQFGLIKTPLPLARSVKRNRNDEVAREGLAPAAFAQNISKLICERYAVRIFQMMNDLAKRVREQQSRSSKVEIVLTATTESAESFNCRCRFAALWTKGRFQCQEARPTFRTCPSPSALPDWSVTYDARDWEQEIEYEIEQSAFGETQRAK